MTQGGAVYIVAQETEPLLPREIHFDEVNPFAWGSTERTICVQVLTINRNSGLSKSAVSSLAGERLAKRIAFQKLDVDENTGGRLH